MMLFQSMSGVSSFKKVDSVDMMDQNRTNVVQTCKSENGRPLPALPPRHCLSALDFLLSSTSSRMFVPNVRGGRVHVRRATRSKTMQAGEVSIS